MAVGAATAPAPLAVRVPETAMLTAQAAVMAVTQASAAGEAPAVASLSRALKGCLSRCLTVVWL